MAAGLREGWTGSSVVMHGRLFVVTEQERRKLKVYEKESDSWSLVEGGSVPEMICKPLCVSSWECRIYVVGAGLRVAVGKVFWSGGFGFYVEWDVVDAPQSVRELIPSNSQVVLA